MHLNLNVHQVYAYLSNNLNKKRTGDLGIDKIYRRIETMIDDQKKEWDAVIKSWGLSLYNLYTPLCTAS